MNNKVLALVVSSCLSLSMVSAVNMYIKQNGDEMVKFDVNRVKEVVFFEEGSLEIDESDTDLKFKVLSDSTVEVISHPFSSIPMK
ncbi:MAG: hypothetical protein E7077_15740 [Bacteroidales bacterium]|nr:hypothetical protein [Bacteroidales bacterium]